MCVSRLQHRRGDIRADELSGRNKKTESRWYRPYVKVGALLDVCAMFFFQFLNGVVCGAFAPEIRSGSSYVLCFDTRVSVCMSRRQRRCCGSHTTKFGERNGKTEIRSCRLDATLESFSGMRTMSVKYFSWSGVGSLSVRKWFRLGLRVIF